MRRAERPVFLNLWQIRFPVTAVTSILHRVSGGLLFLALPLLLYGLHRSLLPDPRAFAELREALSGSGARAALSLPLLALAYHWVAGLRHLVADLGIGLDRPSARASAFAVLGLGLGAGALLLLWVAL